tara:strand:+ start:124 stop:561 length:438 start_codon:yes stop_codon:yes gene_type:complete
MFDYFNNLTEDLQNEILKNIRNPQNKNLLNDIEDFNKSKVKVFDKYYKKGYNDDIDSEFYVNYKVENDLLGFYNDNYALIDGIEETNLEKLNRILSIKNKLNKNHTLVLYNILLNNKMNVNQRINILLGALTIDEREKFINKYYI